MNDQEALFDIPEQPDNNTRRYKLEDGSYISSSRLTIADREDQLDAMRHWFYENYEDPVHAYPHISNEGGYQ